MDISLSKVFVKIVFNNLNRHVNLNIILALYFAGAETEVLRNILHNLFTAERLLEFQVTIDR